jgi:hypothetical protein
MLMWTYAGQDCANECTCVYVCVVRACVHSFYEFRMNIFYFQRRNVNVFKLILKPKKIILKIKLYSHMTLKECLRSVISPLFSSRPEGGAMVLGSVKLVCPVSVPVRPSHFVSGAYLENC